MTGPRLLELRLPDEPEAWTDAGFVVDDGRVRVGDLVVVCDPTLAGPELAFDRDHPGGEPTLDGIPWRVAAATDVDVPAHPNGIDAVDHVVVMAPVLDRVRGSLLAAGFEIRRERPTQLAGTAVTQLFAWAGPVLLEVVATSDPTTEPTSAPSPAGASQIWGLAFAAPDLDATAAWFGDRCSAPRDAVQPGRRIATVRHRDLGMGLTFAVMSRR